MSSHMYFSDNGFHHMNYTVFYKDFQPWEKPLRHTWKDIVFFTCVWYRLLRLAVRLMNEGWILHHSQSKVVYRDFFGLWLLKHWQIRNAYRQQRLNFPRRGGKQNQKTESYVFSGLGNDISHGWERKLTTGRFATGRFWPCTWKISSVGKDQANDWEFCLLKITPIVCFCSVSTHFFILSLSANALYDFNSRIVDPFLVIH